MDELVPGGGVTEDGFQECDLLLAWGRDYLWMQEQRARDLQAMKKYQIMIRGEGGYIYDIAGNKFIDGNSSGFAKPIGHLWPEIADVVAEQMKELTFVPISQGYVTVPAIRLARKLAELAPGSLERTFFCGGGSEAVEVAIQIARQYQYLSGYKLKTKIISRRPEYHGSTYAAMSIGNRNDRNHGIFEPLMPGVLQVDAPFCYRCPWGFQDRSSANCCMLSVASTQNTISAEGGDSIAAFVATPFRVGGSLPNQDYWPQIREICDRNNILFIADEVTLGFGRLGSWFGMDRFGVVPDIMILGKALTNGELPVGAVIVKKEIASVFDRAEGTDGQFFHGTTFGSHPVVMTAGLKNIGIMEREGVIGNADRLGQYFYDRVLAVLQESHPIVGAVFGGLGLLVSIALVKNRLTKERYPGGSSGPFLSRLDDLVRSNGLSIRVGNTINLAPPLNSTKELLDDIVDILDRSFLQVEREFPPAPERGLSPAGAGQR